MRRLLAPLIGIPLGLTRALVYGFPATARRDVPDTTWASLVNDRLAHSAVLEKDPRSLLWMQNRDIARGYSGGPILNPVNGQVLGIVRALIDPECAAAAYGIVTPPPTPTTSSPVPARPPCTSSAGSSRLSARASGPAPWSCPC